MYDHKLAPNPGDSDTVAKLRIAEALAGFTPPAFAKAAA
jgi:hypothetical protein